MYVHRDANNDGIPTTTEVTCNAATGAVLERCDIANPAAGTYIILIQNFQASTTGASDVVNLSTAVVGGDAGNMTVTGPNTVPAGTPFKVNVGWNLPTAVANDRWYGAFDLGTDAANPGNIGTVAVNLKRITDEVSVTKSVSPLTAQTGSTVTYTLSLVNNDTISHTVSLTDVLPAGVTYVPGSVSAGGTYDAGTNAILINKQFNLVKAANYSYEDDLTTPGLAAQSPFGGFIDLTAPPNNLAANNFADNTAGSLNIGCPVAFYDSTAGTATSLGLSSNGLFFPRGNGTGAGTPITTTLPSAATPNRLIAGLWGDFSLTATNGFTKTGYTIASGGTTCADKAYIYQLTNLHTKVGSSPTSNALTLELVYDFADPDVYWLLYDNVRGPLNNVVMGLENDTGTLGLQYLYGNTPANHRPHNGQVIKYYRPLVQEPPLVVTFRATVNAGAPYQIVNTATYTVQGDPAPKTASATLINTSAPSPTATATTVPPTATNTTVPPTATATATTGGGTCLTEGFDVVPPAGWVVDNNSSPAGVNSWFQGNPAVMPAQAGPTNSYAAANFNSTSGAGNISTWPMTPQLNINNGDVLTFYTRKPTPTTDYPDRMQVRLSTSGASVNVGTTATDVGDFTTLLLDINPTLVAGGYPLDWQQFTVTVSGLPAPASGRFAFRYFVTNGGPDGANSDFIGVDTVQYVCSSPPATATATAVATTAVPTTTATSVATTAVPTTTATSVATTAVPTTTATSVATTAVPTATATSVATTAVPTTTATSVATTAVPTATATSVATTAVPTTTATSVATTAVPTTTATSVATTAVPTATRTATSVATTAVPTATRTATSVATTAVPTATRTATSVATTAVPTATATTAPLAGRTVYLPIVAR